jgi:hypothetical protein
MGILETSIVYGILGLVLGATVLLRSERPRGETIGRVALAVLFWPLLAPSVLARPGRAPARSGPPPATAHEVRIHAAEQHLLAALAKIEGGIAEEALAPEVARIRALGGSLASMARRLSEIENLVLSPEFDERAATTDLADLAARGRGDDDPRVASVRARLRNIGRLRGMRDRARDDLERAVLAIEEITSRMRLLEFAGKPDAEVVRLVKEVADGVEGITEALLDVD